LEVEPIQLYLWQMDMIPWLPQCSQS